MVYDWNTATPRSAAQDRWAAEINPITPAANSGQARLAPMPAAPAASAIPTVPSNGSSNGLQMGTGMPDEVVTAPTTVTEAYLTSLKAVLNKNTGNYVVANFLIGTQNMVSWEGILYDVGNDFITIYQQPRERYIVCDIYSLKFIEFYDTEKIQHRMDGMA